MTAPDSPRIIRIIQSLRPSGRTQSALGIHDGLAQGFPSELWALEAEQPDAARKADRYFPCDGGFRCGAVRRLARMLREAEPAIVHVHGTLAEFYGLLAARWAGVPGRIVTIHRGDKSQEENRRSRWRNRAVFACARRVVCMAACRRDELMAVYGGDPRKWRHIYVGVELADFLAVPPLSGDRPSAPVILCTGHIRLERDHETLFRAFAAVRGRFPTARLRLAGAGEEARIAELKALAARLGIVEAVEWLGLRRDIAALLAQADAVAHPALYDNLPRSVIESAAAARPVVATNVGGIPETVQEGRTGLLVRRGDADAMGEALTALLSDPAHSREMGLAGRAFASERFSYDRMVREYADLYREVLSERGR